jgi:hypothetical protein
VIIGPLRVGWVCVCCKATSTVGRRGQALVAAVLVAAAVSVGGAITTTAADQEPASAQADFLGLDPNGGLSGGFNCVLPPTSPRSRRRW